MKIPWLGSLAALVLLPAVLSAQILLQQDFEQNFSPGMLADDGNTPGGNYYVRVKDGAEIVKDDSQALKITRTESGQVVFASADKAAEGTDLKLSFRFKASADQGGVLFLSNGGSPGAALLLTGGKQICVYDAEKKWISAGTANLPVDKWAKITLEVDLANRSYVALVTDADGNTSVSSLLPLLGTETPDEVRVLNSTPLKNSYLIDDIKLESIARPQSTADGAESFESLAPGKFPSFFRGAAGSWSCSQKENESTVTVVADPASGKQAVVMVRKTDPGTFAFAPAVKIPSGHDSALSFKIKAAKGSPVVVYFSGTKGVQGAVLFTGNGPISAYNDSKNWVSSGVPQNVPVDEYARYAIKINAAKKTYSVQQINADGSVVDGLSDHPLLSDGEITEVRFIISHPLESTVTIDDVKYADLGKSVAVSTVGRGEMFRLDMESFAEGPFPASGRINGLKYAAVGDEGSYTVGSSFALSGKRGLKVMRNGGGGYLGLRPEQSLPEGHNYTLEFTSVHPEGESICLLFYDANGAVLGGTWNLSGRAPCAYDADQEWIVDSLDSVFAGKKYTLQVKFNVNEKCYEYRLISADGSVSTSSRKHPFLKPGPLAEIRIIPSLPQKSYVYVDDITLTCDPGLALDTRDAFTGSSMNKAFNAMLRGEAGYVSDGTPVDFEMSSTGVGELLVLTPDKDKPLPEKVKMRAYNAAGHWIELGEVKIDPESGQAKFEKIDNLVKLELRFPADPGRAITKAMVYSPAGTPQLALDKAFAEKIETEYRLAVYDQQYAGCDKAELTFINKSNSPVTMEIELVERQNGKTPFGGKRTFVAQPGTSALFFDLKGVENGEYLTTIREIGPGGKGGVMLRLLRHSTSTPLAATPKTEITGEKVFFPDAFFLSEHENLKFTTGQAKAILAHRGTNSDDEFIVMGDTMGLDKDGNLCINFHTQNRQWKGDTKYHATASFDDLTNWKVSSGTAELQKTPGIFVARESESVRPDWSPKLDANGKVAYRWYDPEKDGKVNLRQVQLIYISHDDGHLPGRNNYNWGVVEPQRTSVWAVWHRSPGEAILLSRPCSGFPTLGALEPPDSGSDLGFGQWLEDDGNTLCYARGRHLMRYDPYAIKYDNCWDRNRMVGVWRTRDGVNWEQGYIGVPDLSKPESDQHYGGTLTRVPNGAGLRVAMLYRYNAKMQQINWEFVYTWDGFRWTRFQNEPSFLDNGPFGAWNHGSGYVSLKGVEHNGKFYQLMHWVLDYYHFEAEIAHYHSPTVSHMDAEYMRKRYEPRHLDEWPLFKKYFDNSYEKLSEHLRNSTCSIGVAEYRKDGFFYATAGEKTARMVTVPFIANGKLSMNTVIRDGGFIEVKLVDENGKALDGYSRRFTAVDSVNLPVFDKLPQGKFKVDITMADADIYTLNF